MYLVEFLGEGLMNFAMGLAIFAVVAFTVSLAAWMAGKAAKEWFD